MNMVFNENQVCVCDAISINGSNLCVPCVNATKISETSCNCTDYDLKFLHCCTTDEYFQDNRCYRCPGLLDPMSQTCTCPDGWFNITAGVCHCAFGYFSNRCELCPPGTWLNTMRTSCYCHNRTFTYIKET